MKCKRKRMKVKGEEERGGSKRRNRKNRKEGTER